MNPLERLRDTKKVTFREIADSTGITLSTVAYAHRNRFAPKIVDLRKYAEFYDVDAYDLCDQFVNEFEALR